MKKILWHLIKAYGFLRYKMNGSCAGYHWALRACCNWCGMNWYGQSIRYKPFVKVGFIKW